MKITSRKTNHLHNPLGFHLERPVFSYVVEESEGKRQKAARVLVSLNSDMSSPVFDSGVSGDIDSLAYPVATAWPIPCTRYYWTVTVFSDVGEQEAEALERYTVHNDLMPFAEMLAELELPALDYYCSAIRLSQNQEENKAPRMDFLLNKFPLGSIRRLCLR